MSLKQIVEDFSAPPSVDSIVTELAKSIAKLNDVATVQQERVVEYSEKMNHAISERDRATRIAKRIGELLA